jgi:hypothetical protein
VGWRLLLLLLLLKLLLLADLTCLRAAINKFIGTRLQLSTWSSRNLCEWPAFESSKGFGWQTARRC